MATIFTKIIQGEIPCYKVAEDANFFAFQDINPVQKGHVLVVPKIEEDYIFRLDDETIAGLMIFAKKVALAMEKAISCTRIAVSVIGLEVPHVHIHLIPIKKESDLNFANKMEVSKDEMVEIAQSIANEF